MKATELRQNNLVTDEFYETFKTIIKVNSINDKGINLEIVDDGNWSEIAQRWIEPEYTFDKLRPIPLTEEILLKCGFNENNNYKLDSERNYLKESNVFLNYRTFNIEKSNLEKYKYVLREVTKTNIGNRLTLINMDLEYLHQLQNLYFALTGQELEINL